MNLPPPHSATRPGSLQRLTERAALWFEREACLAVRFPYVGCDRCARACPVEVLTLSGDGPELAEGCLNCGRCVAACPSEALRMPGSEPKPPADEGIAVRIDCWRVPEALSTPDTLRVPCLGALKVSRLLHLARTGSVTIMDRGWCADCPAGGDCHPALEAMTEANRLLGGTEPAIRIERQPLPRQVAADGIPHPLDQRPTGRRGFLRRLAGEAVAIRSRAPRRRTMAIGGSNRPSSWRGWRPSRMNRRRRCCRRSRWAVTAATTTSAPGCAPPVPCRFTSRTTMRASGSMPGAASLAKPVSGAVPNRHSAWNPTAARQRPSP